MPVRRSCSFCGNDIEPGTGKMFVKKDGAIFLFCSRKCQANLLRLGRVPRWTPWTQAFRRATALAEVEAAAPELVMEAAPAAGPSVDVLIDAPKGRDIPADLIDLMDKKLGPDLGRGDLEKHYAEFLASTPFRGSIVSWAKKAHAGKTIAHIEKAEFLAYKDSPEGRRIFKGWLDGQWQKVKGRPKTDEEGAEAPAPARAAKKRKSG